MTAPVLAQTQIGEPIKALGTVSLERESVDREIEVSEPLFVADIVGVGDRSYARLGFSSGWSIDVPARSVASLAWTPEPDTIFVEVGAVRGTSTPGASRITVVSGKAIAVATGTTFHFTVAPAGATSLYVQHGTVEFSSRGGASVLVTAGQASTVSADGEPPTPPAPPAPSLLQEATFLSTQAALELGPDEALPPEDFARLRRLRDHASQTVRGTPVDPGSPRSLEVPAPEPSRLAEISRAVQVVGATLLLVPLLALDGSSSTTGSQ